MDVQPNRIIIDCTDTVYSGVQTGIQRVVRSLIREGVQIGHTRGQSIMGAVLGATGFERHELGAGVEADLPPSRLRYNVMYYAPTAYVRAAESLCGWFKSRKLRSWLLPKRRHLGFFKPAVKFVELAQRCLQRGPGGAHATLGDLQVGKGDILILADTYWSSMEVWEYVRVARAKGAFVVVVMYDLIPLTHPQFVHPRAPENFRKYVCAAAANADLMVAISKTICEEVRQQLPTLLPDGTRPTPVEAFQLGADFSVRSGNVRDEIAAVFAPPASQPTPYISVSTMDPRKNHAFMLEAFEVLWSRGSDARLMFIGTPSWKSQQLLSRIEGHAERGQRLFVFHDMSDAELYYCYQRARGTISSSFVEGFNLPIVESLWHGRKTFASDLPVHHEVGGEHVVYFDLASPGCLAQAIEQWEHELANGAGLEQRCVTPMSWRESTKMLFEKAQAAYLSARRGTLLAAPSGSLARAA